VEPRKEEEEELLGRLRCRWDYNIKMDPKKITCEVVDCIQLVQDRVQWRAVAFTHCNQEPG
jgi:hypothetical protein